jgi:hypothetical protein
MNTDTFTAPLKPFMLTIVSLSVAVLGFGVLREQGTIDPDLGRRAVAILLGLMLAVTGNVLPKLVRPLAAHAGDPARCLAADRFAGWTFAIAGLIFAALWVFAPIQHVMRISALVGLGAFALVAASQLRLVLAADARGRHERTSHSPAVDEAAAATRIVAVQLLHALLWVFAMFLTDSIWGDTVAQWMVLPFIIASGALLSVQFTRVRAPW